MPAQPESTHLLVVDDEEELLWTLSQRLATEPYTVLTAPDGVAALEVLASSRVDVLVADIRMPRMGGLELVMSARQTRADLPVVVMTAYPTGDIRNELAGRGSIEYLEKPFDFANFLRAVERAKARNARGFTGAISVQTLPDVVQLYALSNVTGALRVSCDGQNGSIWFERGAVPHAETKGAVGADAFMRILSWTGGAFSMTTGEPTPARTITMGWMELVLESCRRSDERAIRKEPVVSESELDFELVSSNEVSQATKKEEVNIMANYKESLAKLEVIDGFIGACLCDGESGMPMAIVGGNANLNLEVAGATNSEVLRAKRKAAKALNLKDDIEDILITLGKQYHIIRPLKGKPMVFFYIALDRAHANLAMARMALADVEREVVL